MEAPPLIDATADGIVKSSPSAWHSSQRRGRCLAPAERAEPPPGAKGCDDINACSKVAEESSDRVLPTVSVSRTGSPCVASAFQKPSRIRGVAPKPLPPEVPSTRTTQASSSHSKEVSLVSRSTGDGAPSGLAIARADVGFRRPRPLPPRPFRPERGASRPPRRGSLSASAPAGMTPEPRTDGGGDRPSAGCGAGSRSSGVCVIAVQSFPQGCSSGTKPPYYLRSRIPR